MRHYEIVFLVHPSQSGQVPEIIQRYESIIESGNGKVHRLENWGLRSLAYPINKSNEAHYVLMNIECTVETHREITDAFHFNDMILRNLVLNRETAVVEPSPIMQAIKKAEEVEKARKFKQNENKGVSSDRAKSKAPSLKADGKNTGKADKEARKPEEQAVAAEDTE